MAEARGIVLNTEGSRCDSVAMMADRQRLAQIVINLLSNAVKYNRRDGTVAVRCGEREGRVSIEVSDTGMGIPEGEMHRLFEPFERVANGETEGTGLGLSLSRRLATLMGGTLELASTGPTGSTFRLELPPAEWAGVAKEDRLAADVGTLGTAEGSVSVLYIEDNVANLRLIESVLAEWGAAKVLSAMQGSIGLEIVRTQRPNVVLLDLHLPDMSGLDALREIRLDPKTADVPVIILSADATSGQIKRALAQGADEYLTKPIDVVKLLRLLTDLQEGKWKRTT
jgi:CheY-like chemotaxis protein